MQRPEYSRKVVMELNSWKRSSEESEISTVVNKDFTLEIFEEDKKKIA